MMARVYHSPRRQADAAATRAEVIAAAAKLFVRDGYAATSQRAIAAEAGVSVPTVQLQGAKHTLLIAAFERSFAGDEGRHSLAERPEIADIMAEPRFDSALSRYVAFLRDANARSAELVRAMMAAADADPAVRAAYADLEQRRQRDMTLAAGWFAQRGRIETGAIAVAADVLGYLTGPDAYVHFVGSRGWSAARYAGWLEQQLRSLRELCAIG